MNAPAPTIRLHWIPVSPSWLVSIGLVILAVLPHQIPAFGRKLFGSTIVRLLFAAVSVYIGMIIPVLGAAMLIFLFSFIMMPVSENFVLMNLNKDHVDRKRHWYVEDVMTEEPDGIQDRTEETNINYDKVSEHKATWLSEDVLEEHPIGIQDKPVPTYDEALR